MGLNDRRICAIRVNVLFHTYTELGTEGGLARYECTNRTAWRRTESKETINLDDGAWLHRRLVFALLAAIHRN